MNGFCTCGYLTFLDTATNEMVCSRCGLRTPYDPSRGQIVYIDLDPKLDNGVNNLIEQLSKNKSLMVFDNEFHLEFLPYVSSKGKSMVLLRAENPLQSAMFLITSVNLMRLAGAVGGRMAHLGEINVVRDQPMAMAVDPKEPVCHFSLEIPQKTLSYTLPELRKIYIAVGQAVAVLEQRERKAKKG